MLRSGKSIVLILCLLLYPSVWCAADAAPAKPDRPAIAQITSGTSGAEGEITVRWGKVSCSGYRLEYADNDGFRQARSWTAKGAGTLQKQVRCLEPGRKYWFRVRAYRTSGPDRVYGKWSASRSMTAHGHAFAATILEEPECGTAGLQQYLCEGCGYSYNVKLAPMRHAYRGRVSRKPNCRRAGERTYTCTLCGDTYSEEIPKTAEHKPRKKGTKTVCRVCGRTLKGAAAKQTTKKQTTAAGKQIAKKQTTAGKDQTAVKPAAKQTTAANRAAKETTTAAKEQTAVKPAAKQTTTAAKKSAKPKRLTKAQRTAKARHAAVEWALKIADDDSFHYGKSSWAHHSGCYFCGTNQRAGSAKRRGGASAAECARTYCCNPFVTAAYCHGAGAKEIDCRHASKRINLANDRNRALNNGKAFTRVKKPSGVTGLKEGDILLTPTHAMLYAGDGRVVHAAHHDNGRRGAYWNSSITCGKIGTRQWSRTTKIYRYKGTGRY